MNRCTDLPTGSIHSFEELKAKLKEAFSHLIKRRVGVGMFLNIKQGPSKSLREYITRFNETLMKVVRPSDGEGNHGPLGRVEAHTFLAQDNRRNHGPTCKKR